MNGNARIGPAAAPPITPSSTTQGGGWNDSRAAEEAERAARYRLVIEQGRTFGTFVYKTLDRRTGEVVKQYPRDEVLKLQDDPDYDSGRLIDTEA